MLARNTVAAGLLMIGLAAVVPQASAVPPVCIEREYSLGPVDTHVGQCGPQSVDVDLCEGDGTVVGPDGGIYRVTAETCLPDPCAAAGVQTGRILGLVGIGIGPGCHVTVSLDLVDCTWQEAWGSETIGPITLRQAHCVDGT